MTWRERLTRLSRRDKQVIAGVAAVVIAIAAVILLRSPSADDERGQARIKDASEMGGMEGMDMGGKSGSARLTPAQTREFGITFSTVELRTLSAEVRTTGVVTFDETRLAVVAPKFAGFIERLYVDFTGKPVRRGQPLFDIYSPELVAAQEELLLAERLQSSLGQSNIPGVPARTTDLAGAARARLRLWDISDAQIGEIVRAGRARRTLTLYAPTTGVVVEKNVVSGQAVQPGEPLYRIADLSEVWVEAQIRETDALAVSIGSTAILDFAGLNGRSIHGRVEYIYPILQEQSRSLRARIGIMNPGGRLLPGMFATVRITTSGRKTLTVPNSAVVNTGERKLVFVDMGGGELMAHEIETGGISSEYTEVLSGLEPGQRVVTSAQFVLDSESNLGEVMRSMVGQMAPSGSMENMNMPMPTQPERR